jgi:glycosyltransferase involved in cell wall biosynthesis
VRILVVSDLPQFVTGGAEMQAARLIEAWLDAGHEVICLGRRMGRGPVALGRHRLTVHRIRTTSLIGRWGRAASYMLSLAWLLLRHRRWAGVVYTRFLVEPAVTTSLLKWVHLIHAPLVATPAGAGAGGDMSFLHSVPFATRVTHLLDRHCAAINLIADNMVEDLIEAGFSGHNFSRIPNGVPLRGFQQPNATAPPVLLSVGRLSSQKGHDVLLRALAQIRDDLVPGQVRIIGDGPERERLFAMARELRVTDRVEWLGQLPQERVMDELVHAQIFLLPSRYEGFSNAGLEAMERGLPLILTRCGGLDRYVDNQIGWVVPPGDVAALAKALSQALATDPVALSDMGARARAVVENNFDMALVAVRYIALFERLTNGTMRP